MSEHPAFDPDWCMAPGVTLAEVLTDYSLTSHTAARLLDMDEADLDAILVGGEPITSSIATRLQLAFGVSADLWIALEHNYRNGLANGKKDLTNEDPELRARRTGAHFADRDGGRRNDTDH